MASSEDAWTCSVDALFKENQVLKSRLQKAGLDTASPGLLSSPIVSLKLAACFDYRHMPNDKRTTSISDIISSKSPWY